jgi:hypothetical protein
MRVCGLALCSLSACRGVIEEPAPGSGPDPVGPIVRPDGSFACDPAALPSMSPLRRLSALQYENTVADLFESSYAIDARTAAAAELDRVPVDDGEYRIMDSRLSEQHVRAYYRVADRLATVATTDENLRAIGGDCAMEAAPTTACVGELLDDFGLRVFRRPLTADERALYGALNDGSRGGRELFRSLVFVLLQAPAFVYHVELDGDAIEGDDYYRLAGYELASRLSYHFWQSMPDGELFAAAADGSLLTEDGYAAQVERLLEDPRTHETLAGFYTEWWKLGWMSAFPDSPAFATLAEGTTIGEAGADHLSAMTDEILAMTDHFTFGTGGTLRDLLLTDRSFTRSPHLAALYGVEPWDGVGEPPRMPEGQRSGILTRAAFLVNDGHLTHPIHRGAVVRRRMLCDALPQPDPASLPEGSLVPPPVTSDQTTREQFENKTENEPCATCHRMMNPIGYVLEQYDALGRYRTEERVIDEATGEVLATLPIDSSANPALSGDALTISTGAELSEAVADSRRVESCFARQYYRFTFARGESGADGCALERVRSALASGGTLRDALRSIALDPSFRARRVQ